MKRKEIATNCMGRRRRMRIRVRMKWKRYKNYFE